MDNRQRRLQRKINKILDDIELWFYLWEEDINDLVEIYKRDKVEDIYKSSTYSQFRKEVSNVTKHYFTQINKILRQELNSTAYNTKTVWCVDGKSLDDRLAIHKAQMIANITKALIEYTATGVNNLNKYMKAHKYAMQRLVNTEARAKETIEVLAKAKADGYKYVEIVEMMDDKTCDYCIEMNGKIVPVNKAQVGINVNPFHPNCRGHIIPYK